MGDPVHPSKPAYEDVASQGFGSWVSFSIEPKAHHGFQLVVLIGCQASLSYLRNDLEPWKFGSSSVALPNGPCPTAIDSLSQNDVR